MDGFDRIVIFLAVLYLALGFLSLLQLCILLYRDKLSIVRCHTITITIVFTCSSSYA